MTPTPSPGICGPRSSCFRIYHHDVLPKAHWLAQHEVLAVVVVLLAVVVVALVHRTVAGGIVGVRIHVARWRIGRAGAGVRSRNTAKRNLTDKLRQVLGYKDTAKVPKFVWWPRNTDDPGAAIVLQYPKNYTPLRSRTNTIPELLAQNLGGTWTDGTRTEDHVRNQLRYLRDQPAFVLPAKVAYRDLEQIPDAVPLGIREDGKQFIWDFAVHIHAHALIFGATGSGKSNLIRIAIAEFAKLGALIDIIDAKAKHVSDFGMFEDLPCVRVHRADDALADIVTEFGALLDRRREMPIAELSGQPVRLLVIDEMWEFIGAVKRQYARSHPRATIKSNPALIELERVARMGRFYGIRMVVGTQTPAVDDIGGRGIRGQLGFTVALGKVPVSDGAMIFRTPPPPVEMLSGRGVVEEAGEWVKVQIAKLDMTEAHRIAANSTACFPPDTVADPEPPEDESYVPSVVPPPESHRVPDFVPGVVPDDVAQQTRDATHRDTSSSGTKVATQKLRLVTDENEAQPPEADPVGAGLLSPVELTCGKCGQAWVDTSSKAVAHCPGVGCRASKRIPRGARSES